MPTLTSEPGFTTFCPSPPATFKYEPWRHGGWYVYGVRYPSGACGCVSRQMTNPATGKADRKWRIVCDERTGDHTYPSRDMAALAEWHLAQAKALEGKS
jgi:hypothetical protein